MFSLRYPINILFLYVQYPESRALILVIKQSLPKYSSDIPSLPLRAMYYHMLLSEYHVVGYQYSMFDIHWGIWVRSRESVAILLTGLVNWFCYQLIAKQGNKTATPLWPGPYQLYTNLCMKYHWIWCHNTSAPLLSDIIDYPMCFCGDIRILD